MKRQLREVMGLGVATGMRLPDGSLWGSYRREARDEVHVALPDDDQAERVWRGLPQEVKAPKAKDWNPKTRKWSWE